MSIAACSVDRHADFPERRGGPACKLKYFGSGIDCEDTQVYRIFPEEPSGSRSAELKGDVRIRSLRGQDARKPEGGHEYPGHAAFILFIMARKIRRDTGAGWSPAAPLCLTGRR